MLIAACRSEDSMLAARLFQGRCQCQILSVAVSGVFRVSNRWLLNHLHHNSVSSFCRPLPLLIKKPHPPIRSLGTAMEGASTAEPEKSVSGEERTISGTDAVKTTPSSSATPLFKTTPSTSATPSFVPGDHTSSDGAFSYIKKGFTSEIFKIELVNLPSNLGYKVLHLGAQLDVCYREVPLEYTN